MVLRGFDVHKFSDFEKMVHMVMIEDYLTLRRQPQLTRFRFWFASFKFNPPPKILDPDLRSSLLLLNQAYATLVQDRKIQQDLAVIEFREFLESFSTTVLHLRDKIAHLRFLQHNNNGNDNYADAEELLAIIAEIASMILTVSFTTMVNIEKFQVMVNKFLTFTLDRETISPALLSFSPHDQNVLHRAYMFSQTIHGK